MIRRHISIFLSLLCTIIASATNTSVRFLTGAEGLSNSSVNSVFRDSNGFMWFGTWDGVSCWNGRNFRVFTPDPSDSGSLCSSVIREIGEDGEGCLWFSTDRGIDRYNPHQDKFTHFFTEEGARSESEKSFHLCFDYGGVYASVDGKGIYRYEDGAFTMIQSYPWKIESFIVSAEHIPVVNTKDHMVVQGSGVILGENVRRLFRAGSYIIIQKEGAGELVTVEPFSGAARSLKVKGEANAMCAYENGFLTATSEGLFRFADFGAEPEVLLEGVPVLSVYVDPQGIIWAGTDMMGVAEIVPSKDEFTTVSGIFDGRAVRCFAEDGAGRLYIGTKGAGIFVFSGTGVLLRRITTRDGLPDNSVYALTYRDGYVWVGTDGIGVCTIDDRSLQVSPLRIDPLLRSVYSIVFTSDGRMLAGTSGGGLYVVEMDGNTPVSHSVLGAGQLGSYVVYSVLQTKDGTVWAGTRGGGVRRIGRDGSIKQTAGGFDVISLEEDSDGMVWVGTTMGLYKLSPDGKMLLHLTEADGLPSNTIHSVLYDGEGFLWAGTTRGLCRVSLSGSEISCFYAVDGLQDNEFSDGACYRGTRAMYFGGIKGFSSFNPRDIEGSVDYPELRLFGFYLDNEPVSIDNYIQDGTLIIKPEYSTFSFNFVPLDYVNSHRCEVAYLMDGFNSKWVRLGSSSNAVVFSNLRPGKYTLNVRCTNADGRWSPETFTLPVRVQPYWYLSPLAVALYIVVTVLAFLYLVRTLRYRSRMRNIEDVHEGKLRFFTNIAHEFSNSLTLISGPCEQLQNEGKLSAAQQHCVDVIEHNSERMQSLIRELILFRKAEGGHLSLKIVPVKVDALLSKSSGLFRDKMETRGIKLILDAPPVEWNTDAECLEKIVFNLISNAVKYTSPGENVIVKAEVLSDRLEMSVTNTGVGIRKSEMGRIFDRFEVLDRFEKEISKGHVSSGIGLSMCKSLAEALGGRISLDSDGTSFVTFLVSLPERTADADTQKIREREGERPIQQPVPAAAEESQEVPDVTLPDILVVDDDADIRSFIASLFKGRFNVMEASDGEEALRQLSRREPVLILSDVVMDGMDGNRLLRSIKDNPATRHIPFILLSAQSSLENQIEGIESGADAYIGKPFSPRHLIAMADRLLGHGEVIKEYSESSYSAVRQFEGNMVKNEDKDLVIRITDVIVANMDNENLTVDDIADETAISKMKLYRKLKETVGMSPTEYIRHIRLENAARLLKTTGKTVQEIIYACGFSSKTWFYREFSKKYGITPNEYRNAK